MDQDKPTEITEGTVEAMLDCNNLSWRWLKVYYALKDRILNTYGKFCDLTLQEWADEERDYCSCEDECICGNAHEYAYHSHILMRYLLGSVFFHIPTDEFSYYNEALNVSKESPHYRDFINRWSSVMAKKKERCWDHKKNNAAFKSLKWLLRQYSGLLHQEVPHETQ